MRRFVPLLALASLLAACEEKKPSGGEKPPTRFTLAELKDPANCQSCHKRQFDDWAMSMHAYASKDPVFIAMNKRGQRETKGELGDFCVKCHAPMAVREGLTKDGLNIEQLPPWAQGVTCYFCHNVNAVGDTHANADLSLANDSIMRGSFNGVEAGRHGTAKSAFHESLNPESSRLCGSCHDVVNQHGVHIERTFAEYKDSIHNLATHTRAEGAATCQGCHMPSVTADYVSSIAPSDAKRRDIHDHSFPAVDVALTDDFPGKEEHALRTRCTLGNSVQIYGLEIQETGGIKVQIEHIAGHKMPSGTAQDRRLWLQLKAYDETGALRFETGTIRDDEVEELENDTRPNRIWCMYRDHWKDDAGKEVHMFWEAKHIDAGSMAVATSKFAPHVTDCNLRMPNGRPPARIELVMKMRPVGIDVLQSLVKSGDLDPKFIAKMPTFELHNTKIEWRAGVDPKYVRGPRPSTIDRECEQLAEPPEE